MDLYSATLNEDGSVTIVNTVDEVDPTGQTYKRVVDRDARQVNEVQDEIAIITDRIASFQTRVSELQAVLDQKATLLQTKPPVGQEIIIDKPLTPEPASPLS